MKLPTLPTAIRYWFPPLLWAALIFTVSSVPTVPTPDMPGVPMDKVAHAAEYGIFGVLLFRAFHRGAGLSLRSCILYTALFAAAYALSDETHQYFVGRECEWGDLVADSIGGAVAAFATAFFYVRFHTTVATSPS